MKSLKIRLAFQSEKPVNFKFGDVNISIGQKPVAVDKQYADLIMKQYPDWIELVVRKTAAKSKVITKEA